MARELIAAGMSGREAAKKVGIPKSTLNKNLRVVAAKGSA
jgi:transposase